MSNLELVSPWVNYCKCVEVLFQRDENVTVKYNTGTPTLIIYATEADKAYALSKLFPEEKEFGNVTLKICVEKPKKPETDAELVEAAFKGNHAFSCMKDITTPYGGGGLKVAVFKAEVVQYFNDDIGDPNGLRSTLYQELAKEVFPDVKGVNFCTSAGF